MSWIYLVLAGLCEIGWPLGFKLSQTPGTGPGKFAQRNIPIGTAYAV